MADDYRPKDFQNERREYPALHLAAVIQMAKSRGWSTARIVREMSSGLTYADSLKLAGKAAPLLDISVMQFMRLRKN